MSGVYFLKFLKVIFLLSPFEKLHHSLFYLINLLTTAKKNKFLLQKDNGARDASKTVNHSYYYRCVYII